MIGIEEQLLNEQLTRTYWMKERLADRLSEALQYVPYQKAQSLLDGWREEDEQRDKAESRRITKKLDKTQG